MTQGMRKGLTSYGDADFSLFLRKAFIKAMGLSDDALARPIVGIANTFSDYNACHGNVPTLVEAIKRGVMLAGGLPIEFPPISVPGELASPPTLFPPHRVGMAPNRACAPPPSPCCCVVCRRWLAPVSSALRPP